MKLTLKQIKEKEKQVEELKSQISSIEEQQKRLHKFLVELRYEKSQIETELQFNI